MPDLRKLESLLVADIGSATTKVTLVDLVAGEFRFVGVGTAATTTEPPNADVWLGVREAITQVQAFTERRLLTDDGQQLITPERPDGRGVDAFATVTSAPMPLRVAIVGLSREVSLASAERAVKQSYTVLTATLALDESGGRWLPVAPSPDGDLLRRPAPTKLQDPAVIAAESLARANPEVIVLVGGTDGGATTALFDLANLVAVIAAAQDESARPTVIFAGNSEARSEIAKRVGQVAQLRVVDNVRPELNHENLLPLQRELDTLYAQKKIAWLPGLNALTSWSTVPVISSARAFENVVRFLARRYNLNVVGADLGSAATTIIAARGETYTRAMRADLGIGSNLENIIAQAGIQRLMDWLPLELTADEARVYWLNQSLHPRRIAATRLESHLQQVAARIALSHTATQGGIKTEDADLILLTGGAFARNTNMGAMALLALDALQPRGIFTLAMDTLGLAPAFGGLAGLSPEAATNVLERDGFVTLGTVIAPLSRNREGQIDLRITIRPASSGTMNLEVQHGAIELIPLMPGQKASIEVRPAGGVSLGPGRSGVFKAEIEGGALGLVIDARGRPIILPSDAEKRRAQVQRWYWDIGGEVSND